LTVRARRFAPALMRGRTVISLTVTAGIVSSFDLSEV
jgi:hypothetical protein